jgi:5,10-methylenetetrahydromethanopterin reductase
MADGNGAMRFSYCMLPDYPLNDSIEMIKTADELGFYACYSVDETWHKDLWVLFAAAADKTKNIRFGPSLSPVTLREPSLIAQAAATLDELTGGRAEVVLGSGNFGLLAQYHIDWAKTKPLSRLKEAHHAVRTLLDDGAITYDGEFYKYTGLFTFARPVQERLPVKLGAMRGPKSFQAAGELTDGVHHALSYTKQAYEYMVENVKIGAEKSGRDVSSLDLGAWIVFATGEDSSAAKDAARAMVGLYASSMPKEQLERNGVDPATLTDIIAAVGEGRVDRAFELTPPELADKLSVAGTPEECAEKIKTEIASTGVNHLILAITDAALVKAYSGVELPGVATMREQLQLVHDKVMPAFASQPA